MSLLQYIEPTHVDTLPTPSLLDFINSKTSATSTHGGVASGDVSGSNIPTPTNSTVLKNVQEIKKTNWWLWFVSKPWSAGIITGILTFVILLIARPYFITTSTAHGTKISWGATFLVSVIFGLVVYLLPILWKWKPF